MEPFLARPDDPRLAPGLFLPGLTLCVLRADGTLWPADALPLVAPPVTVSDPSAAPLAGPTKTTKAASPTPAADAASAA